MDLRSRASNKFFQPPSLSVLLIGEIISLDCVLPRVLFNSKSQQPVMWIGDLDSSLAFGFGGPVTNLHSVSRSWKRWGIEFSSKSVFSYFKHIIFKIFTQLRRLYNHHCNLSKSLAAPHMAFRLVQLPLHCGFWLQKIGHEWQGPIRNQRRKIDMKPRVQLGLSDTTSSSRTGNYLCLDEDTQSLPAVDEGLWIP